MLLSEITQKNIYVGKNYKGVCLGIGISIKTQTVKYLLCATKPNTSAFHADFAVNISALESVSSNLYLSSARAAQGRSAAKLFIGLPVFYNDGTFLGNLQDVEMENFAAINLLTSNGEVFSVSQITASQDALILKKEQPFPIGQRIPAPVVSRFFDKNTPVVTKSALRESMQKGALIKLTLSLPPFDIQEGI